MLKTSTQLLKLAIPLSHFGAARFCSYHSKLKSDQFTPFSKEKTVRGLHLIQHNLQEQNAFDTKNIIRLDPLSETPHSETYRIFDRHHKKFFAQKVISLDSLSAWEQLNLSLKQYTAPTSQFAKIVSIDYNEGAREARVYSELHQKLVGDYSFFRIKNHLDWTNKELESMTWQLTSQMNELRHLDAKTNSLGGMKMFIDEKTHSLKLFEYSDLKLGSEKVDMDAIVYSLVQIMNPYILVHNAEEARSYLKNNYPEFLTAFQKIEKVVNDCGGNTKALAQELKKHLLSEPNLHDKDFHKFISKKLTTLVKERNQGNPLADAGLILQGLGDHHQALKYLQDAHYDIVSEFGEYNSKTSESYLRIAALNRDMQNYDEAAYNLDKAMAIEKTASDYNYETMSKIHNEYGKILSARGKFPEARKKFQEAEMALKKVGEPSAVLKKDIQKNISLTDQEKKISDEGYSLFKNLENENTDESIKDGKKKKNNWRLVFYFTLLQIVLMMIKANTETPETPPREEEEEVAEPKKEIRTQTHSSSDQEAIHEIIEKEKKQQAKADPHVYTKTIHQEVPEPKMGKETQVYSPDQEAQVVRGIEEKTEGNSKAPIFFFLLFASIGIFGLTK